MNEKHHTLTAGLALAAGLCLASLPGCVAHAHGAAHAGVAPVVFHEPPTLVAVGSGVWVVRDYHAAVYYVDGHYWHFSDGVWYRAASWDADTWVTVEVNAVPVVIVDRDHTTYVSYTGPADAETRKAPPAHAAAKHGGPPGHDDPPGLGNQRRDHTPPGHGGDDEERPEPPGHAEGHGPPEGQGPPEHAGEKGPPDHAGGPKK